MLGGFKSADYPVDLAYTAAEVLLFAGLFLAAPDGDPDGQMLPWAAELLVRKR
ncbi:hypothetical protein Q5741_07275 [Paenibacillus sp. JX-17]|uniref:Uncharacterized protein n=1 Tax=Paenibacillus lacisoli TaxID=3064525 RepID=A0ABT9CC43_9BACL|nr:hypothetical protein [Paenibacillus sp. JX-17]